MIMKTPKRPSKRVVSDVVNVIRGVLEAEYGPQKSARREIEYVMYAALLVVDDATHHQSDTQRVASFRGAAAMFDNLAQTYYVDPIKSV